MLCPEFMLKADIILHILFIKNGVKFFAGFNMAAATDEPIGFSHFEMIGHEIVSWNDVGIGQYQILGFTQTNGMIDGFALLKPFIRNGGVFDDELGV